MHYQQSDTKSEGRNKKFYKNPIKPGNQIERDDKLNKIEGKKVYICILRDHLIEINITVSGSKQKKND